MKSESPLQFDVGATLAAPVDEVFAWIADFGGLPKWMPFMRRVEVDNSTAQSPGEVGSVRVIYPPLMPRPTREHVRRFDPPHALGYSAEDASLMGMYTDHYGLIELSACGDGEATRLRWRTYARPGRNVVMHIIGRWVFGYVMRYSLRKLRQKFGTS